MNVWKITGENGYTIHEFPSVFVKLGVSLIPGNEKTAARAQLPMYRVLWYVA